MRVRFSAEALQDVEAHRHLTAAFWACQDRGHDWLVDDLDALLASPWARAEGEAVRAALATLGQRSVRRGSTAGAARVVTSRAVP